MFLPHPQINAEYAGTAFTGQSGLSNSSAKPVPGQEFMQLIDFNAININSEKRW
jgi:hypothetical protein